MSAEDRDYTDYLQDIFDASQKAIAFCEGMDFEEFEKDEKTTDLCGRPRLGNPR